MANGLAGSRGGDPNQHIRNAGESDQRQPSAPGWKKAEGREAGNFGEEQNRQQNSNNGFTGDQAGCEQINLMTPPTKMADEVSNGRYIPTATSIGERAPHTASAIPKAAPIPSSPQAICPPTIPFGQLRHQARLRRGQRRPPMPPVSRLAWCRAMIGPIKKNASKITEMISTNFHFPGRSAEQMAGLQVLNQRARHRARHADHGGDAQHGRDSRQSGDADGQHHQRGDNQAASVNPESGWLELPTRPTR
jgi:hypothetical protein